MDTEKKKTLLEDKAGAASVLGCCKRSVDKLIKNGELPSVLVGRRRLIPAAALENFIRRKNP